MNVATSKKMKRKKRTKKRTKRKWTSMYISTRMPHPLNARKRLSISHQSQQNVPRSPLLWQPMCMCRVYKHAGRRLRL